MHEIFLTFDVEEFDLPLDYGSTMTLSEQIEVSRQGLLLIQDILDHLSIRATFFITGTFALHNKTLINNLSIKHEIASHAMFHCSFDPKKDLAESKKILEEITGQRVTGFRRPFLKPVKDTDLVEAGYRYNSSLNPTHIPGRYNNWNKPIIPFFNDHILNIPVSVSPILRIPLFWLSFKNFPMPYYRFLSTFTLRKNGFLNLYFHPWEFTDLSSINLPHYMKRHSGVLLLERLEKYLIWLKGKGRFITLEEYTESICNQQGSLNKNN
ncbi:MAG: polysaccharide deacetylase family protein [Bacteroidota bacterium]